MAGHSQNASIWDGGGHFRASIPPIEVIQSGMETDEGQCGNVNTMTTTVEEEDGRFRNE